MEKVLKSIKIIQTKEEKKRLNPFNPLTYFFLLGAVVFSPLFLLARIVIEVIIDKPFKYK